jgi:hypothetical protein
LEPAICNNVIRWAQLNPEYDYFLFDDAAVEMFIGMEYGSDVLSAYQCVQVGAAKCDIWRLLIVYLFGGIYFDLDVQPVEPFRTWGFGSHSVVTNKACRNKKHPNGCANQWGLIYTPFHRVIHDAIEETIRNLAKREASHVYDVAFWAYYNSWTKGPYNSSYMPGWKPAFGDRVKFMDVDAKNLMVAKGGHWQSAKKAEDIWKQECLLRRSSEQ